MPLLGNDKSTRTSLRRVRRANKDCRCQSVFSSCTTCTKSVRDFHNGATFPELEISSSREPLRIFIPSTKSNVLLRKSRVLHWVLVVAMLLYLIKLVSFQRDKKKVLQACRFNDLAQSNPFMNWQIVHQDITIQYILPWLLYMPDRKNQQWVDS